MHTSHVCTNSGRHVITDDPELRSDETVIMRTQGVYVKSIPFEGILTDRRIILVDRVKNLLPPKEIPLSTVKEVQTGENAIRDQIITLSVVAKNGVTRQVILTFSRQSGGNRVKERDEWIRHLREHNTHSVGQMLRNIIPGHEPAPAKTGDASSPKIEIVGLPVSSHTAAKKGVDSIPPVKMINENAPPISSFQVKPSVGTPVVAYGTFCSRCGNRVPEGSEFCNRCGSKIVIPGNLTPLSAVPPTSETITAPVLQPAPALPTAGKHERPIDQEIQSIEPLIERETRQVPRDPLREVPPNTPPIAISPTLEPPVSSPAETPALPQAKPTEGSLQSLPETSPSVLTPAKPSARRFIPRLFSPKDLHPSPLVPGSMPTSALPSIPQKPRRRGKGKYIAICAIVIILIAVVAGVVLFVKPNIGAGTGASTPSSAITVVPTGTSPSGVTAAPAVTLAHAEPTAVTIPATGTYVHVNYIGGWNGTYGLPDAAQQVTNSGERLYVVENATGTVQASFWKLDGSTHEILVEIYKDGKQLTKGVTSARFGKVTLSADATTGIAQTPVITGESGAITTTGATTPVSTVTGNTTAKITSQPTTVVTIVSSTSPSTNTTAAS